MNDAYIFLNGDFDTGDMQDKDSTNDAYIIGVDGGVRHLRKLGLNPDLVIGDLDSVSGDDMKWILENAIEVKQFPSEKDQTDFELSLEHAISLGSKKVQIFGALGGRMDHTLANISLLSNPRYADIEIRLVTRDETLFFIHKRTEIKGNIGDIVSLLPWGDPVTGVITIGLKYPLRGETLFPYQSRGMSNVLETDIVNISIKKGILLCVHQSSRSSS